MKRRQTACKPGSVRAAHVAMSAVDGHSSGTRLAARLARPTRATGRKRPCVTHPWFPTSAPPAAPIRSCSRWGLPCRPRRRGRGALLPHRFTLADCARSVARDHFWLCGTGGLFSVALSLGSPPPAVSRHRISVEPGLSSNVLGLHRGASATVQPSGGAEMRALPAQVNAGVCPDLARTDFNPADSGYATLTRLATASSRARVPASAWPLTASPRQ